MLFFSSMLFLNAHQIRADDSKSTQGDRPVFSYDFGEHSDGLAWQLLYEITRDFIDENEKIQSSLFTIKPRERYVSYEVSDDLNKNFLRHGVEPQFEVRLWNGVSPTKRPNGPKPLSRLPESGVQKSK